MKVVIISVSNSGNTKFIGDLIVKEFEKNANFSVAHFDGCKLVKILNLSYDPVIIHQKTPPSELSLLHESLQSCDVLAVGSVVAYGNPARGFVNIFNEKICPNALFNNIKYFFTFCTCTTSCGNTHDILATAIQEKNAKLEFCGSLTVYTPDSFSIFLPPKGFRDVWNPNEFSKVTAFCSSVINYVHGKVSQKFTFKTKHHVMPFHEKYGRLLLTGDMAIDQTRCIRCHLCVRNCPNNALSADLEDSIPTWNPARCNLCSHCMNCCPRRAISFPRVHTAERELYPAPFLATDKDTHSLTPQPLHGDGDAGPDIKGITNWRGIRTPIRLFYKRKVLVCCLLGLPVVAGLAVMAWVLG